MQKGIKKIFSEVPHSYELINHILTWGMDVFWRRKAAQKAVNTGGGLGLDVCTGTGEMVQNISRLAGKKVRLVAVDFCLPMLAKATEKTYKRKILFTLAEADSLPFPDKTFDFITISFATRNINPRKEILINCLKEFCRVLKPRGHFINLETSQPSVDILRKLFHLYVRLFVKPIGYHFSGSKAAYRYLSFTIPRFYPPEEFSGILRQAGFRQVTYRSLLGGVSAIHIAIK
jgi:demethylmenaquinone methyltransferase/2-methoxy-6-polyprenyl-1,4-benzoquinol methylase